MKEIRILGICRCCGNKIGLSNNKGYVQLACTHDHVEESCANYLKECPPVCQYMEEEKMREIQATFGELIFAQIKLSFKKWRIVFFQLNSHRDYTHIFEILKREGWLFGEIIDEKGSYYRAFPNKEEYTRAFMLELKEIPEGSHKECLKKRFEESLSNL